VVFPLDFLKMSSAALVQKKRWAQSFHPVMKVRTLAFQARHAQFTVAREEQARSSRIARDDDHLGRDGRQLRRALGITVAPGLNARVRGDSTLVAAGAPSFRFPPGRSTIVIVSAPCASIIR
jgi:hypothetical protein